MYRCRNTPGVSRISGVKSSTAKRSNNEASLILQIKWTSSTMPLLPCKTREVNDDNKKWESGRNARKKKRNMNERIIGDVAVSRSISFVCPTSLYVYFPPSLSLSLCLSLHRYLSFFFLPFFISFNVYFYLSSSQSYSFSLTISGSVILAVNSPNTDNNGVTPMPPSLWKWILFIS